jgi:predicted DNA-binding transcriptional regulator AlpA
MLPYYLRYRDLEQRQIVNSRAQLKYLQDNFGFPKPTKLGPRLAGWTEQQILGWLETQQPRRVVA